MVGEMLLHAEAKLGEILAAIPKVGITKEYSSRGGTIPTLPAGVSRKDSYLAQQIAKNPKEGCNESE